MLCAAASIWWFFWLMTISNWLSYTVDVVWQVTTLYLNLPSKGKGSWNTAKPNQVFTPPVAGVSSKVMNIY